MGIIKNNLIVSLTLSLFVFVSLFYITNAQELPETEVLEKRPTIEASNLFVTKVAPGEFLPISIKVLNFGGPERIDVTITYYIFNDRDEEVYQSTETVAVETSSTFTRIAQIPFGSKPGNYVAKASIVYKGQSDPAVTQFPFVVEEKIFGLFKTDFYRYNIIFLPVSLFMLWVGYGMVKRRKLSRLSPFNYEKIDQDKRIYFEIISDTITEMRLRVGDRALEVASSIHGLKINKKSGEVLEITEQPFKVIALLVSGYENVLGQKVSFSFRKPSKI